MNAAEGRTILLPHCYKHSLYFCNMIRGMLLKNNGLRMLVIHAEQSIMDTDRKFVIFESLDWWQNEIF